MGEKIIPIPSYDLTETIMEELAIRFDGKCKWPEYNKWRTLANTIVLKCEEKFPKKGKENARS